MVPEGIIYPFQKLNWSIHFYNLDHQGNPNWEELPKNKAFDLAVLIHLFGQIRNIERFKHSLCADTKILEDFAHLLPDKTQFQELVGDFALWSLPKLLGLPDGALLFKHNSETQIYKPRKRTFTKWLYINLNYWSLSLNSFSS